MTERKLLDLVRDAGLVHPEFAPFMWMPVGSLPYLRIPVPPGAALRIDGVVRKLPLSRFAFVNQVVIAQKP